MFERDEMSQDRREHIGRRTLRGVAWAYGSYVGGRVLVLASTAVLARLLDPDDFGVVALSLTFMALLEGIADLGLGAALVIQEESLVDERADTVFYSAVALGAALSAIIAIGSPLASNFFYEPELKWIAAVLGCNFFLRSLGSTHYALSQRGLDFRTRTAAEFADVVIRGGTGVGLALAGFGAWSLVIGYLVGTVSLDVTLWLLVPWRPSWPPRLSGFRAMVGFGSIISAVGIVAAVIMNIDNVFVGRVLGAADLGVYALAFTLPSLLIINFSTVAGYVLYPAFSAVRREDLPRAYLISLRYTLMVGLPLTLGLLLLARPFVLTVFGEKWSGAITPLQLLTLYAFATTVGFPAGTAYKATGRAAVLLTVGIARLVLVVLGLALFVRHGIWVAAATQGIAAAASSVVGIVIAQRLLAVSLRDILRAAWPALAAGAVMAVPMFLVEHAISEPELALAVGAVGGAVLYVVALVVVAPDSLRYLRQRLSAKEPERPPPTQLSEAELPVPPPAEIGS